MSKLEVKEIGPISGETDLKLGQSGGTVTLADGATAVGFGLDIGDIPEPTESPVKAWVNFNGMGVVAIKGSGNVSSITDVGIGNYQVNFTNTMADGNYAVPTSLNASSGRVGAHTSLFKIGSVTCKVYASAELSDQNEISVVVVG